jgi:sugar lactone lactonase YvrE
LADIFNKKQDIEKETQEIESTIIPQYRKKYEESESKLSIIMTKFDKMDKEKERNRKFWHREVDTIFNKLGLLMKTRKDNLLAAVKSHQFKINSRIPNMIQTLHENKEILNSKKVSEIFDYKSKLKEYRNVPVDIDIKIPLLKTAIDHGRELSLEIEDLKATLTGLTPSRKTDDGACAVSQELLDQAKSIITFPSGVILPLGAIACVGVDGTWVSGRDKTVRRVDIHGSVRDTVTTTCYIRPFGITVTKHGELVYSDHYNRAVNIVKQGKTEKLITTPWGWHPGTLCCTKSGDIIIYMFTTGFSRNKIVLYQGDIVKQEIDRDENGSPIFEGGKRPLCAVENNNGDICVSDNNANVIVVVNKSGRVRFRYDGTTAKKKEPFNPGYVVTDSMSQIIMTDYNNDCLHILDQNGQFLRCVGNCGLNYPNGLSIDSEGRLWVGLVHSGEVKVIQNKK